MTAHFDLAKYVEHHVRGVAFSQLPRYLCTCHDFQMLYNDQVHVVECYKRLNIVLVVSALV